MSNLFKINASAWCYLFICLLACVDAGLLPFKFIRNNNNNNNNVVVYADKNYANNFDQIAYHPNGTLSLQFLKAPENATKESLLQFKAIQNAIKLASRLGATSDTKLYNRIYGEGVEHKFPPLVERVIQRIQSYFSVYKYTDTSRPVLLQDVTVQPEITFDTPSATEIEGSSSYIEATPGTMLVSESDEFTDSSSVGDQEGFITVGDY